MLYKIFLLNKKIIVSKELFSRIHKAHEYGSNTDPDSQHGSVMMVGRHESCWLVIKMVGYHRDGCGGGKN